MVFKMGVVFIKWALLEIFATPPLVRTGRLTVRMAFCGGRVVINVQKAFSLLKAFFRPGYEIFILLLNNLSNI